MKLLVLAAGYATRLYPLTATARRRCCRSAEADGRPCPRRAGRRSGSTHVSRDEREVRAAVPRVGGGQGRDRRRRRDDERRRPARARSGTSASSSSGRASTTTSSSWRETTSSQRRSATSAGPPGSTGAPLLAIHDVGDLELVRGRYNSIEVDAHGRITFFEEKPEEPRSTLSGIALYFYPRDSLPLIREYLAAGNNPDQPGRLVQWLYPRVDVYTWHGAGRVVRHRRPRAARGSRPGLLGAELTQRRSGSRRTLGRRARLAVSAAVRRLPRPGPRAVRSLLKGLRRIPPPLCERCGAPTAWPVRRCGECAGRRLAFASARAAIVYDEPARALVRSWKERGLRGLTSSPPIS